MAHDLVDLDYLRQIGALIRLQGREYLTHPGLLRVAHEHGLKSIISDLISWDPEKRAAVIRTVVEGERGTFTGYGDACPANVAKHLIDATLRMAETRAINRALRLYTGLGMTTTEELPGESEPEERRQPEPEERPLTEEEYSGALSTISPGLTAAKVDLYLAAKGRPAVVPEARRKALSWLRDGGSIAIRNWSSS